MKEFSREEITDRYEGQELAERRAQRPPEERFSRLEEKHDELKKDVEKKHDELKKDVREVRADVKNLSGQVSDMRADVAGVGGKLEGQEKLLTETLSIVKQSAGREADRAHVALTAELDIDRAQKLAKVEIDKEFQLDTLDAKKKRREAFLRGLAFVASGGGLVELLHKLGVL